MGWLDLLKSDSTNVCTSTFNWGDNCLTSSSSDFADVLMYFTNSTFCSS